MNKFILIALSVSGGILSGLAWTEWCSGLILLVSLVPFLLIENHLSENRQKYQSTAFFSYLVPGFVIFTILTLGWIRAVSLVAALCVIMTVALLMSFTLWLSHFIRLRKGSLPGFISLVVFWLSLEFLFLRINIFSPWINLGNGLSKDILFIQWYEVTGSAGGTLWILISNLLLFQFIKRLSLENRKRTLYLSLWLAVIILPAVISLIRYKTIKVSGSDENEFVVVQPNYDPYSEKFTIPIEKQIEKVIVMAESMCSDNTDWLVAPETIIYEPVDEKDLSGNKYISMIKSFAEKRPSVNVVAGMVSFMSTGTGADQETGYNNTLQPSQVSKKYFNSAFKINAGEDIEIYHKSKLVPAFEYIPSGRVMEFISRFLPVLGGTNRGYSTQEERTCFVNSDKSQKVAPVICYESVYGEYITDYIKKGAGAIFIITNDGWWKNTNGYKHHFSYASLRAIETRRPVVRAANTGVSCLVDIRGKATMKTKWWESAAIKGTFFSETRITQYVRSGDFLMVISNFLSVIILTLFFVLEPVLKKLRKSH